MYGICGVPCLWENHLLKILFFKSFPPQKNAQVVNLQNSDLNLIRRIHPECEFYGFMIRFWICPKKRKIQFWIRNSGFGFSQKTYPQTPYFLPALTPAFTFKFKLLALHKRGKYKRQHILGLKIYQTDDQFSV